MSIDAMKQALEAIEAMLESINSPSLRQIPFDKNVQAMVALRAAIKQEQEPVAWIYPEALEALKSGRPWTAYGSSGDGRIPLYLNDAVARRVEPPAAESGAGFESLPASPTWWDDPVAKMNYRKWQGLTADEIWQCNAAPPGSTVEYHICMAHQNVLDFAEAIEAKLRERNT